MTAKIYSIHIFGPFIVPHYVLYPNYWSAPALAARVYTTVYRNLTSTLDYHMLIQGDQGRRIDGGAACGVLTTNVLVEREEELTPNTGASTSSRSWIAPALDFCSGRGACMSVSRVCLCVWDRWLGGVGRVGLGGLQGTAPQKIVHSCYPRLFPIHWGTVMFDTSLHRLTCHAVEWSRWHQDCASSSRAFDRCVMESGKEDRLVREGLHVTKED